MDINNEAFVPYKANYIKNQKGGKQLRDCNNHVYHKEKVKRQHQYWICSKRKQKGIDSCSARAIVDLESDMVIGVSNHSHMANIAKVEAKILVQQALDASRVSTSAAPKDVFGSNLLQKIDDDDVR